MIYGTSPVSVDINGQVTIYWKFILMAAISANTRIRVLGCEYILKRNVDLRLNL